MITASEAKDRAILGEIDPSLNKLGEIIKLNSSFGHTKLEWYMTSETYNKVESYILSLGYKLSFIPDQRLTCTETYVVILDWS